MPGCPALISIREPAGALLPAHSPVPGKPCLSARQQIPAAGAQQEPGLSLLPDSSLRHSQAFASVLSLEWSENFLLKTLIQVHTHRDACRDAELILAQDSNKTSAHNQWELYRSQR